MKTTELNSAMSDVEDSAPGNKVSIIIMSIIGVNREWSVAEHVSIA